MITALVLVALGTSSARAESEPLDTRKYLGTWVVEFVTVFSTYANHTPGTRSTSSWILQVVNGQLMAGTSTDGGTFASLST